MIAATDAWGVPSPVEPTPRGLSVNECAKHPGWPLRADGSCPQCASSRRDLIAAAAARVQPVTKALKRARRKHTRSEDVYPPDMLTRELDALEAHERQKNTPAAITSEGPAEPAAESATQVAPAVVARERAGGPMATKKCAMCGDGFEPKRSTQRMCGKHTHGEKVAWHQRQASGSAGGGPSVAKPAAKTVRPRRAAKSLTEEVRSTAAAVGPAAILRAIGFQVDELGRGPTGALLLAVREVE